MDQSPANASNKLNMLCFPSNKNEEFISLTIATFCILSCGLTLYLIFGVTKKFKRMTTFKPEVFYT